MRTTINAVTWTAVLALGLVACGQGAPDGAPTGQIIGASADCPTDGDVAPDPRPASTAKITIVEPKQGELIEGNSVTVRVKVTDACILEEAQNSVRPDTGHVHIAVDGMTVTLLAGTEYTVTDLTPGRHTIEVEFSAADHGPFNPPVLRTVRFRVGEG